MKAFHITAPILVLFVLHGVFLQTPAAAETDMCQIAQSAISEASSIRKLTIQKDVPCQVQDKDKVKEYILSTISTKITHQKLRMEELVYKAIGFIPDSFDYEKGLVDLYVSQIGGYYDPEMKHFIMAAWIPALLQTTVAVHELTHALQDQYFDLEKFMDPKIENSDLQISHSALVEGDATAVMVDYTRKLMGQGSIIKEKSVESIMMQNVIGVSLMGMNDVPPALVLTLVFPYTSGLRFVHYLLQQHGFDSVNEAFKRPPQSTEEILHPEKYLANKEDFIKIPEEETRPAFVDAATPIVYKDTLGEFAISALLGMYVQDKLKAANAASGWGGDRIVVFGKDGDATKVVAWKTHWDSEKDADEFHAMYQELLKKHQPNPKREVTVSKRGQEVVIVIRVGGA